MILIKPLVGIGLEVVKVIVIALGVPVVVTVLVTDEVGMTFGIVEVKVRAVIVPSML